MSKTDVRQLMKKGLAERKVKIDSPYAKYNATGQLQCILCNSIVKTEAIWPAHCKSKTHVENQARYEQSQKKTTKAPSAPSAPSVPSPAPTPSPQPSSSSSKKAPPPTTTETNNSTTAKRERDDANAMPPPPPKKSKEETTAPVSTPSGLPSGFFENYAEEDEEEEKEEEKETEEKPTDEKAAPQGESTPAEPEAEAAPKSSLPAGFFDDPTVDAKVRGAKTPAKLKEEEIDKIYEKYQESIGQELRSAEKIQVELLLRDESIEDESENTEVIDREQERREMEEKMAELKKKAERIKELKEKLASAKPRTIDVGDDDVISPDAFYDWRAKSSIIHT